MKRRAFLRNGALGAAALGGAAFGGGLLRADGPGASKNLLVVLNFGGWDTTYALDPKPGLLRIDAPEGTIRRFGEAPIFVNDDRPAVTRFFEQWGSLAAVVNGVQVRSFVHSDCVKRILTGGPSETDPDFAAISAHELGRELPIPYLAFGSQARSGRFASLTGRTGTVNQLITLTDPSQAYPGSAPFLPGADEDALVQSYLEQTSGLLADRAGRRGLNGAKIDDFLQSQTRSDLLVQFAQENGLGEFDYTPDLSVQVPLAVRALRDGLAKTVMVETQGWDTHTINATQREQHEMLYTALDGLMMDLDAEGMLDDTLVVVLSEMGRTPKLNNEVGKDHWPVTSAMFLGGSVAGGRSFGGTDDELRALSMNLQTGALDAAGKQLQTSNLVAGILDAVGVDVERVYPGVEPFRAFCA